MSTFVKLWILLSAFAVGAGWLLSAVHELNRSGYVAAFALAAVVFVSVFRNPERRPQIDWFRFISRVRHRFRRPAPCLFLLLACLSLAAGFLYVPADGDSDAYRIPRVLHWLGAQQWHWIATLDIRMNISGCGSEWLSAPVILFTDSFRFIFLINWLSFLMLPGLIFSVFVRLQVPRRVAWWWMWLLASGWCCHAGALDYQRQLCDRLCVGVCGFRVAGARRKKNYRRLAFADCRSRWEVARSSAFCQKRPPVSCSKNIFITF